MTVRVSSSQLSPNTTFTLEADVIQTDIPNNRWRVRFILRARNDGNSGSNFGGTGVQIAQRSLGGTWGEVGRHSANPFLPSGFGTGAQRWADQWDVWINANAQGYWLDALTTMPVRMLLNYGVINVGPAGSLPLSPIPQAPTTLAVARVSDAQHSLSWTRVGTYTSVIVQRQTDGGAWQQVGVAAGNAASFTDTTTVANRKYAYRVAGVTAAGQSGWSGTVTVFTTPAAPTGVTAARNGSDIVVNVGGVPPHATSFDVRDGVTQVGTSVSLPWTHVAPNPAVPHTYQVRGKVGSLLGAWSASSNTVQLISPPNAPGGLVPNGAVRASDEDVTFNWVHNPVDSSAQSAYELRHRAPAGAWTTLSGSTASSRAVALASGSREWEVRTKGAHADWSPWSATAVVTVITRPGVAVTQPDATWDASVLPVQWSWLQAESRPQSAWQVELSTGGGVVESRSGSGAATELTLNTRLVESDWTVRVRAATGDVWSVWASAAFTVTFDPPLPPMLAGEWDEGQGGVGLTVDLMDDEDHPATVRVVVERLVEGDWEHIIDVTGMSSLVDWESPSYGDIQYRATAYTVEGAIAETVITVEARSDSLWLSGGNGFGITGRLPFDPQVSISAGRARALKQFAGRPLPVAYTGEALARTIAVSGRVMDFDEESANVEQLTRIAQLAEDRFMFRDPDGRRVYGVVGEIQMPRESSMSHPDGWNGVWGYSFTLTETEPR